MKKSYVLRISLLVLITLIGCEKDKQDYLFDYVESSHSKLDFVNTIVQNDSVNPKECLNCFNGGGVGIGDFNLDGLPDVVFTGNQVSSKIYLNKGGLQFQDVTVEAGIVTEDWITGIVIVDVNADGLDDIYLNVGGTNCEENCYNLLYINQGSGTDGIPTFKEEGKAYGLDDGRYAQQAIFFDYDQDGDLDVYIVHNKNKTNFNRNTPRPKEQWPEYLSDKLLRNDQIKGMDHPFFTDVSKQLGLTRRGFGLGVGIADFNNDQQIDLYVSNDFISDDFFYLNQAHKDSVNPIFHEASNEYLGHITTNAMGMDIADINNDGISDIMVLDMLPKDFRRHKRVMGEMNYNGYQRVTGSGYTPQYMRNTLQLGNGLIHGKGVKSSEVSLLHDISSTDWSWATLMVDFDNDGDKDIYVSNGYIKDVIDLDYIEYSMQNTFFTPKLNRVKKVLDDLPSIEPANIFFEQQEGQNFVDVTQSWAEEIKSLSNGVAYADFDLDGDLDIVVNNINQEAFLLENKASEKPENRYLRIKLKGTAQNPTAIGAKVSIWTGNEKQFQFQSVVRGYLSSVEPILHFGLKSAYIDSIKVVWPDGMISLGSKIAANQVIEMDYTSAKPSLDSVKAVKNYLFTEDEDLLSFSHRAMLNNEFRKQPLLLKQYSQIGPTLAVANIDGKPGDEVFVGGNLLIPGAIWFQNEEGVYHIKQKLDSIQIDSKALFFDADGDADLDLFIGSGGNLFDENSPRYADRIYLNDGNGHFDLSQDALPQRFQSTSTVVQVDMDHDGDLDLFVGSGITPKNYPISPKSAILINQQGRFSEQKDSDLTEMGMVTDALWVDIDQDGWEDLITVGEFAPISIYKNHEGSLKKLSTSWVDEDDQKITTEGWWKCIRAGDFDNDGDMDFLAGNQGLNYFVKPEEGYPIYVYNKDFDENGSIDPIVGKYFQNGDKKVLYPIPTRDDVEKQFPETRIQFITYEQFAEMDFQTLLEIKDLESETFKATTFASSYIENLGNGKFKMHELPQACQMAPINAILIDDFNGDKRLDALLVGNDFYTESNYGRIDACTGIFLEGTETGFNAIPTRDSGFYVPNQSNALEKITDARGKRFIIAGQHNERIKVFE